MWSARIVSAAALACLLAVSDAAPTCPILGPVFPKPKNPSLAAAVKAAVANLTTVYNNKANDNGQAQNNLTWSVEVYSVNEPGLIFSHYHTQENLHLLNNTGVDKVDTNSVYRLGSLTKIFTTLTWLVQDGDIKYTTPITEFVPELKQIQAQNQGNSVWDLDWDSVTIGALMSQMSGLNRDYALLGELTQDFKNGQMTYVGFPTLPQSEVPQCGEWPVCNETQFWQTLPGIPPVFPVDSTPAYSNLAFQILSYALQNIKGKAWLDMLDESVLTPLGLNNTFYNVPANSKQVGAIPGNFTETGWQNQLGDESPAGSMYSSAADMAKLGRAIMSSKLIPGAVTRRWLKPVTFSSDPLAGVSSPWGIRRIPLGQEYRYTYAYQKAGTIKKYSALMILLPDYDVGFNLLMVGDMPPNFNFEAADDLGYNLIPALEEAARAEAAANYAGVFRPADPYANSSMTIATDTDPGLVVTDWMSDGVDTRNVAVLIQQDTSGPVSPRVRLYPTLLRQTLANGTTLESWKAVFEDANLTPQVGKPFSTDCASWLAVTSEMYGGLPLDEFVFTLDATGKAVSVSPIAWRATFDKVA